MDCRSYTAKKEQLMGSRSGKPVQQSRFKAAYLGAIRNLGITKLGSEKEQAEIVEDTNSSGDGSHQNALNGYKTGTLQIWATLDGYRTDYRFQSSVMGGSYQTNSSAYCLRKNHVPPVDDCTCGFYALTDMARIWENDHAGAVEGHSHILHVTLTGDVIEGTKGYRAEKQHVTQVTFRDSCVVQTCEATANKLGIEPAAVLYGTWSTVHAYCDEHIEAMEPISISELANIVGIDMNIQSASKSVIELRQRKRRHGRWWLGALIMFMVAIFASAISDIAYTNKVDLLWVATVWVLILAVHLWYISRLKISIMINVGAWRWLVIGGLLVAFTANLTAGGLRIAGVQNLQQAGDTVMVGRGTVDDLETILSQYDLENSEWKLRLIESLPGANPQQYPQIVPAAALKGQISLHSAEGLTTVAAAGVNTDGEEACVYIRTSASELARISRGDIYLTGYGPLQASSCDARQADSVVWDEN